MDFSVWFRSGDRRPHEELKLVLSTKSGDVVPLLYVSEREDGGIEVMFQQKLPPAFLSGQVHNMKILRQVRIPVVWYVDNKKVSKKKLMTLLDGRPYKAAGVMPNIEVIAMLEIGDIQYYAEIHLSYDENEE